jgi:predicted permease
VGRLNPGVTLANAQGEMTALAERLSKAQGNNFGAHLKFLEDYVTGKLRRSLLVAAFAVGFVLLIACTNLSNLLLAKATARKKELALRLAVGASRYRLVRQMLTESVVLSLIGAALGLPLAYWGTRFLSGLRGTSLPMLGQIEIDWRALLFTLLLSTITGLIFGILPALRASRCDVNDALKEGTSGAGGGHRDWTRSILVVSEVALSFILLGGAGLMMKSLIKLLDTDLGFRPDHVAIVRVDPGPQVADGKPLTLFLDRVVEAVRQIPGISAASVTDAVPLDRDRSWGAGVVGKVYRPGEYPIGFVRVVGPGYFTTMRIPQVAGRGFTDHDTAESEKVIVINESMARRLFPGENPLGQWIRVHGKSQIIGVVGDVKHSGLEQDSGMEFYIPYAQGDIESADLVVRTTLKPEALASALRRTVWSFAPNQPLSDFKTLDGLVDTAASPRRFIMLLLAIFAGVALVLASVGIYGVISYSVAQRTREMGIRMALGADASGLKWQVVRHTLVLSGSGAVLGIAGLAALSRFISAMLFQVTATDPATFVCVTALLIGVAAVAGYIPARRVARISPMTALRFE